MRHPTQKGWRGAERPTHRSVLSLIRPAYSRQLPVTITSLVPELGNSQLTGPAAGRDHASMWAGGRRRRSSLMPGGNGRDTVKVRQERSTRPRDGVSADHAHGFGAPGVTGGKFTVSPAALIFTALASPGDQKGWQQSAPLRPVKSMPFSRGRADHLRMPF